MPQPHWDPGPASGIHWAPDTVSHPPARGLHPGPGCSCAQPLGTPDTCPHLGPPLPPALCLATRVRSTLVSRLGPEVGAVG